MNLKRADEGNETIRLRRIAVDEVPTLVVVGSEDVIAPPSVAEAMREKIEGSRLVRIEGAGHVSNVERPGEFNRALVDFLRGLPS